MRDVFIVSAARTAVGRFGGVFKDLSATHLSMVIFEELARRAQIEKKEVNEIVWGECHQQINQCNTARVASIRAGFPKEVTGITVNRVCTSGMQAIVMGTQIIKCGDADIIIAGGVESMSSAPYILRTARWGQRLRHGEMSDAIWEGFTCGACDTIMGLTAENLAQKYGISRFEQDEIALQSQQRAGEAIQVGRFKDEIVGVDIKQGRGGGTIETDEHPRPEITMDELSKLPPIFKKRGTVTAGNSSAINDGAAGVLLMSEDKLKSLGLKPMGRVMNYSLAGVEPELMGYGPVIAVKKLFKKTGLTFANIDLIELNEAFAAQYLACERLLDLDRTIVNVNGSGIALGHPVGCTGARISVTLLYELIRRNAKIGLATLCGMGGVSTALVVERC